VCKYNPEKHRRRSIRLNRYNYSRHGAYFVTICTQDRECLFGNIQHNEIVLNNAGEMVCKTWNDLSNKCPGIVIDEFIVMPNHVHGIICIVGAPFLWNCEWMIKTGQAQDRTEGQAQDLPLHRWGMLLEYLNQFQHIYMQLMLMQTIGRPFPVNYGSVIIMNTSREGTFCFLISSFLSPFYSLFLFASVPLPLCDFSPPDPLLLLPR